MCDIEQPVQQLALLLTLFMVCEVACADFRHLYNNSNVRGPGGGIPRVRRALRTRPVGNVPSIFDDSVDWAAQWPQAGGLAGDYRHAALQSVRASLDALRRAGVQA